MSRSRPREEGLEAGQALMKWKFSTLARVTNYRLALRIERREQTRLLKAQAE
jgi:hypothetical protein